MNFVIIFSGQGLQSVQHVQEVKDNLHKIGSAPELELLLQSLEHSNYEIFDNQIAQPFIFTLQYLRWQQILKFLPEPEFLAGYSLGEVSAFCCSSAMPFNQAFSLISTRAKLMSHQTVLESGLVAIQGLNSAQLEPLLKSSKTEISIKLNEVHYIIGGELSAIDQLIQIVEKHGAQHVKKLNVSIPSHTHLLKNAAHDFSYYLNNQLLNQMHLPIISASHGQKYSNTKQAISILSQQVDHSLDWYQCMSMLQEYRPDIILEIGPGNALSKMINEQMPNVHARSIDDFSSFDGLRNWMARFI